MIQFSKKGIEINSMKIKEFFFYLQLLGLFAGCTTTLESVQNTHSRETFNINDVVYNNTTGFKVFQILEDGSILASHPGYVHYSVNHNTGIRADLGETNFLDIHVIPLQSDYVDGQALRCGYYKYIGNYKYKTVKGEMRTVRQYLEVVEKAQD